MKSIIPNTLTSLNLVFGVFSIISTAKGDFFAAGLYIVFAMVADALDGRAARYFNVSGEFGKELDSLCDLGSFGVAPAFLLYQYSLANYGMTAQAAAAIFAVCGAMRLARFNVNVSVVQGFFMGMPIPAAGCIVATFVMADFAGLSQNIILLAQLVVAYLMVSSIKYPDFKGKGNPIKMPSTIMTVLLLVYVVFNIPTDKMVSAIPFLVFFTYATLGIINQFYCLLTTKKA